MPKQLPPSQRFLNWFEKNAHKEKLTKAKAKQLIDKLVGDMHSTSDFTAPTNDSISRVKKRTAIYIQRLTKGETAFEQIIHRMVELQEKAASHSSDRTRRESLNRIITYIQLLAAYEIGKHNWTRLNEHTTLLANRQAYRQAKPYAKILLAFGLLSYLNRYRCFPKMRKHLRNHTYDLVREQNAHEDIAREYNVHPNKDTVDLDDFMSSFISELDLSKVIARNKFTPAPAYKAPRKKAAKKKTNVTSAKRTRRLQTIRTKKKNATS